MDSAIVGVELERLVEITGVRRGGRPTNVGAASVPRWSGHQGPSHILTKRTRRAGTPSGRREARKGERSGNRESKAPGGISPPGAVFSTPQIVSGVTSFLS